MMLNRQKTNIIIFLICIFVMFYCLVSQTNLFEILYMYLFDSDFRSNFGMAESNIQQHYNLFGVIVNVLTDFSWEFDTSLIFSTNLFQIFLPLLCSISGISFAYYINTLYPLEMYRYNTKKTIIKKIFFHTLNCAVCFLYSYIIIYLIVLLLTQGQLNGTVTRNLFNEIFGFNLFLRNPYIYFIIEGLIRFFLMPFVYVFFSCTIALVFASYKKVLFSTNLYYFGVSAIAFGLSYLTSKSIYINPTSIMVVGSLNNVNTTLLLIFSCIPLWISLLILWWKLKDYEI